MTFKLVRTFVVLGTLVLAACAVVPPPDPQAAAFGVFPEPAQTQWLDDGRRMVLLRDFVFVEPDGMRWTAAAAHVPIRDDDLTIDGASIPPVFWSIVGGPYEGRYRNASIVHDAECAPPHKHRWQDVHRMFYRASRAGGTPDDTARIMFAAIWHFGPRWTLDGEREPPAPQSLQRPADAHRLIAYLLKHPDLSLADIESLSSETLANAVSEPELERLRQDLQACNDPLAAGRAVAARAGAFNQRYRSGMPAPAQPCPGLR